VGDLWIDMYNFKIIPHHGVLAATYAIFHSFLPLLRFLNGVFIENVSLHLHQKYFFSSLEEPIILEKQGLTLSSAFGLFGSYHGVLRPLAATQQHAHRF
jgi:hypothetical protein